MPLRQQIPPERIAYRANSLLALQAAAAIRLGGGLCRVISAITGLVRVKGPIAGMAATLWVLIHPDLRRVARIRHALTLPSYRSPLTSCAVML